MPTKKVAEKVEPKKPKVTLEAYFAGKVIPATLVKLGLDARAAAVVMSFDIADMMVAEVRKRYGSEE